MPTYKYRMYRCKQGHMTRIAGIEYFDDDRNKLAPYCRTCAHIANAKLYPVELVEPDADKS